MWWFGHVQVLVGGTALGVFLKDLRQALRMFRRQPLFTLSVVLILALSPAASAATESFSRMNRVATVQIAVPWLTSADLDQLQAEAAPDRIQMFLAPNKIRYADGSEWNLTLDATATNYRDALRSPPAD